MEGLARMQDDALAEDPRRSATAALRQLWVLVACAATTAVRNRWRLDDLAKFLGAIHG